MSPYTLYGRHKNRKYSKLRLRDVHWKISNGSIYIISTWDCSEMSSLVRLYLILEVDVVLLETGSNYISGGS